MTPMIRTHMTWLILLIIGTSLTAQDSQWKLKRETENLQVYHRKVAESRINELKLVTTLDASLSEVVAVFSDVEALKEWVYKCSEAKRLEQVSETEGIIYTKMDFPWPLSDRDLIARGDLQQDPQTRVVTSTMVGVADYMPEREGVIRIPQLRIKWTFKPVGTRKVYVEYELLSDPGGNVPAWLINLAIDQGPIKSMEGLREMLKRPKYQNQQFAYIQD